MKGSSQQDIMQPDDDDLRQERLLSEYAQCQTERSSSATRVWQATSVFLAALAIAAVVLGNVLSNDSLGVLPAMSATWAACIGAMAASVLWGWALWDEWFAQRVALVRMEEIEAQLGWRHQLYSWGFKHIAGLRRGRPTETTSRDAFWPWQEPYWLALSPRELTMLDALYGERHQLPVLRFLRVRSPVPPSRSYPGSIWAALFVAAAALGFGVVTSCWLVG
jgi:hypothetical protein